MNIIFQSKPIHIYPDIFYLFKLLYSFTLHAKSTLNISLPANNKGKDIEGP